MGLLDKVLRAFRSDPQVVQVGGFSNGASKVLLGLGGRTESNEIVNSLTAMHTSIVFACVRIISEKVATTPLNLLSITRGSGKELAFDHDYYDLIHSKPNPEQDSVNFRVAVQSSALLEGNGYIEIQRDKGNRVVALWHRSSRNTRPFRDKDSNLLYETTDGMTPGTKRIINPADMVHIMATSLDGFYGLNPIEYQRRAIGQQIAMDKFGARFFANYATPQLALINKSPLPLGPADKTKAREDWEMLASGSNQHRIAILDNDYAIQQLSISQEDAQYLQTKLATRRDIAAIYGVPGHMVGDTEKGIKANVEQQAQDFLTTCLGPWLTKWEYALNTKLFASIGRSVGKYEAKFDTRDLLRPDAASRTTFYQSGIQNGYLCPDEVRALEGFNPIGPEGKEFFIQLNMQRLDQVGAQQDQQLESAQNQDEQAAKTGKQSAPEKAQTKDNEVEDEAEERSANYAQVRRVYTGLFRDAVGRFHNRNTKDTQSAQQCFEPAVNALNLSLNNGNEMGAEATKAIGKFCDGVVRRSKKWDVLDTDAHSELNKCIRSLVYANAMDQANAVAKAALVSLDEPDEVDDEELSDDEEAQRKAYEVRKARMKELEASNE
jgi:HK97 family phage portal protein